MQLLTLIKTNIA